MPIFQKPKKGALASPLAKIEPRKVATEFVVPSLDEALPELGDLMQRKAVLAATASVARRELRLLEDEDAADTTRWVHPDVAAALGDPPSPKTERRARIKELRHEAEVANVAITELDKRIGALSSRAAKAVCDAMKDDRDRVLAKFVDALKVVDDVHRELGELFLAVEAVGASTDGLGPIKPYFLGDFREPNRRVATYLKEIAHVG